MKTGKRALAFMSIVFLALTIGLQSPAFAAASGPWQIGPLPHGLGSHNDWCLEVQGGSIANSAQVQLWNCAAQTHREWYFDYLPSTGHYHIYNRKSQKCLNVQGGVTTDSAKIIQFTCQADDVHNDQWALVSAPFGGDTEGYDYYYIVNLHSGACLNVQGGTYADGVDLIQFHCSNDYSNQFFTWFAPGD